MASLSEPPAKRRKLNAPKQTQIESCIWCEDASSIESDEPHSCICHNILSALKKSNHHSIEITNAGTSSTPFKCYKLSRNEMNTATDSAAPFQVDCDDDIDFEAVSRSLDINGIVILRNLLPSKDVLSARRDILSKYLSEWIVDEEEDSSNGMSAECKENVNGDGPSLLSSAMRILSESESVASILEHRSLFDISSNILRSDHVVTPRYKWLRAVAPDQFTGLHFDSIYMGTSSKQMLSIWIPIGDIEIDNGPLLWCYGSHRCPEWKRHLDRIQYGDPNKLESDGTDSGWITDDTAPYFKDSALDSKHRMWCTTDFKAGDVAIFGLKLIHQTLRNDTNCFRISCDTRWQPLCQPLDRTLKSCGVSFLQK